MEDNTLQQYVDFVIEFLDPLIRATEDHDSARTFLHELGYETSTEITAFTEVGQLLNGVFDVIETIDQMAESGNPETEEIVRVLVEFFVKIGASIKNLVDFGTKIQQNLSGSAILVDTDILTELPVKLVDYLLISFLEKRSGTTFTVLNFIGIIEDTFVDAIPPHIPEYTNRKMHWDKIPLLFSDPMGSLRDMFIDNDSILYEKVFFLIQRIGVSLGVFSEVNVPEIARLNAFYSSDANTLPSIEELHFLRLPLTSDPLASLAMDVFPIINPANSKCEALGAGITFGSELEIPLGDKYRLLLKFGLDLQDSLGIKLDKDGNFSFENKIFNNPESFAENIPITFKIVFESIDNVNNEKFIEIGTPDSSRLEIGSGSFTLGIEREAAETMIYAEIDLKDGLVVIDFGSADGFVSNIAGNGIESNFNLGIGFSNKRGLYFKGGSGLEIKLPTHIELGPIEIQGLTIGLIFKEDKLPLTVAGTIAANLGPIKAVVENIGVKADFSIVDDKSGNLGPLDLTLGFKPPNGIGLSVDAGVVKGGGYLFFDFDREEYAGALELVFSEWIALKAVGLITTRLPDGSKGFSMVIIISVEFGSGLQLGFGFTLLGVGGILGINRTVNIDAMSAGVQSGAIQSVMFPENVVANAPKIISDLRQFFPALNNQFLIGPMAKIGYGTPTLISLSLGVIIEFPDVNITILGVLKVALPTEEASVIKLQVNFLGRIEPSNNLLWFYAFLFESRILFITLEGGMGLLVNWGDNSNFVVSVGGFHPRFSPPPLPFPAIPRIAVNILNESAARIRIEGYFAVTSNTVQFGARAELFFGFSAINVQGHLGFDALFQFDPFFFIFEFSLGLSVKVFGFGLFSIDVSGLLEGPAKWHIEGTAKWKITWFGPTIRVNINETWGEEKQTELPPIEAFPLLEREFVAITNWEAVVPKQSNLLVTLRKLGDTESAPDSDDMDTRPLVLHPVGTLRISQRKIPLKLKLDKIGSQQPSDVNEFSVSANLGGGGALAENIVKEKFARGEFQELDKATKLSSPAFEKYESGLTVSADGDALQTSMAVKRIIRYETIIIDNLFKRKAFAFYKQLQLLFTNVFAILFTHFLNGNAITKSILSFKRQKQMQPNKEVITIKANEYSVAFNDTNKPVEAQAAQFESHAEAMDYLSRQRKENAMAAQSMHVIPNTEVNKVA